MKCSVCGSEIKDGAKKCTYCGEYANKFWRGLKRVRVILEPITFVAAIVVVYLMYASLLEMKEQIRINREILAEGRPNIYVKVNKIDVIDNRDIVIYYDIANIGKYEADDIDVALTFKSTEGKGDTSVFVKQVERMKAKGIKEAKWKVLGAEIGISYTLRIKYSYKWAFVNKQIEEAKYYVFSYDNKLNKYGYPMELVDEEKIKKYWK